MAGYENMSRYAFKSHVEYYIKALLKDPIGTSPDSFMREHGFTGEKLQKLLKDNSIITKDEKIIDPKEKGDKPQFQISFRVCDNPERKIKRLYQKLFEVNVNENLNLESVFKDEDNMKQEILKDKKSGKDYKKRGGIRLDEDGECAGATTCGVSSGPFVTKLGEDVIAKPIYRLRINERQAAMLRKHIMDEATTTFNTGAYQYTVPFGVSKNDPTMKRGGSISVEIKK